MQYYRSRDDHKIAEVATAPVTKMKAG